MSTDTTQRSIRLDDSQPIDLTIFCGESGTSHYSITTPWIKRGWKYATDLRISVRIPTIEIDTPEDAMTRFPDAGLLLWPIDGNPLAPWPERRYCVRCLGRGVVGCEGKWGCDGCSEYSGCCHKCLLCGGRRSVQLINNEGQDVIAIGEHWIKLDYDDRIRTLPNVRYVPNCPPDRPLRFVFDGGQGLVMGQRRQAVEP